MECVDGEHVITNIGYVTDFDLLPPLHEKGGYDFREWNVINADKLTSGEVSVCEFFSDKQYDSIYFSTWNTTDISSLSLEEVDTTLLGV